MTRRASIIGYCLAIAALLLGLQSWSIAVDRIEDRVVAAIEQRTGLVVTGHERAQIALLPLPRISLSNVTFRHRDTLVSGAALRLRARTQLLPLLTGRIAFEWTELVGPNIDVDVTGREDSISEWLAGPMAALSQLNGHSRIMITGGSVFIRDKGAIRTILREVNLVVDDREKDEPLMLSGTLNWRGMPTEVALRWPMAAENARVSLTASTPAMNLQFNGLRSGPSDPVVNGQLTLTTRSLPELLGWFEEKPRLAEAFGPFSLAAEAQIKPREASLSNVIARIDGDQLVGAVKLGDSGGRLALSGTLAGAGLDLGRLLGRLDAWPPARPGAAGPVDFEAWTAQDVDLRISVDALRVHGARLGDAALYLLIKKGRFEAGLLRAGAYGGSAKGRLLALAGASGVDLKLQGGFDRINLTQAGADLPQLLGRLTGTGALNFTLDGLGRTSEDIIASLSGKAGISLRQGEIGGVAFADMLRRIERAPAPALRDWRQGKTGFDSAAVTLVVANGTAIVTEGQMQGPSYRLTLAGQASLPARSFDMGAVLTPLSGAARLPFTLKGPLAAPEFDLDMDGVLRAVGTAPTTR